MGLLYLYGKDCPVWIDAIYTILLQKTRLSRWILVRGQLTNIGTCEVLTDEEMEKE